MDCILANEKRFCKKALDEDLVLQTQRGTLKGGDNLPDNWIECLGPQWVPTPQRKR